MTEAKADVKVDMSKMSGKFGADLAPIVVWDASKAQNQTALKKETKATAVLELAKGDSKSSGDSKACVAVESKAVKALQLNVMTLGEKPMVVTVSADTTGSELKSLMQCKYGVAVGSFTMDGKSLDDNQTLTGGATISAEREPDPILDHIRAQRAPPASTDRLPTLLRNMRAHPMHEPVEEAQRRLGEVRDAFPLVARDDLLALIIYTGTTHAAINDALCRCRTQADVAHLTPWQELIWHAMRGLRALPRHEGTTWRGTARTVLDQAPGLATEGSIVRLNGFTSTSTSQEVARRFMPPRGVMMQIRCRTGRRVDELSLFSHEAEVLYGPACSFRVVQSSTDSGGVLNVTLEEVQCETHTSLKVAIWVDDNIPSVEAIMQQAAAGGVSVVNFTSTQQAIECLGRHRYLLQLGTDEFRVLTDMNRQEGAAMNATAGCDLIGRLRRDFAYEGRVMVFTGSRAGAQLKLQQAQLTNNVDVEVATDRCVPFACFAGVGVSAA